MAPFKLKFRMGGSRSTSQEVDSDPQVNEALLNHATNIGASSSTIDSADCTSLGSMGNERKSLLPNRTNNLRLGYLNPNITQCENSVPKSPPPSYDHVLEENTRLASNLDLDSRLTLNTEDTCNSSCGGEVTSKTRLSTTNVASCEHVANQCTDPDCTERNTNISDDSHNNNNQQASQIQSKDDNEAENEPDNRKESIDSTEYLLSRMTAPSSEENLLDECSGSGYHNANNSPFHDPLMHGSHHINDQQKDLDYGCHDESPNQPPPEYSENPDPNRQQSDSDSESCWESNQMGGSYSLPQEQSPEIISNKSSKEIYKAVAKQWGITCKMSDQCRCMECQSHYFDCEYDDNEHQKTDGGLGAGTPMFISEVMQGSACVIL